MKKLFFLLAFFTVCPIFSQVISDSGNLSFRLITTKDSDRMKSVEGSPYLNEDFEYGIVSVEGKNPLNVYLRYNVFQEQVEIKPDLRNEDTFLLPNKETTIYKIGPQTLVFEEIRSEGRIFSGFFIEHYNGENLRLLEKPVATLTEAVKAQTGYETDKPARIKIEEEFFVVDSDGQVTPVRIKHRDVKKTFKSPGAKKYLSENNIRSKEDLISFISFLDKN